MRPSQGLYTWMSAEKMGLLLLGDLLVSIFEESHNVWLIHQRQVDMPDLSDVSMVDSMTGRHVANRNLGQEAADWAA